MIRASTCKGGSAAVRRLALFFALCLAAAVVRGQENIELEIESAVAQEHYLAGTKLLDGGRVEEAVHEFELALQLNGKETWHETADGATRNDYFPRRELGVAYFKLGRLDEAEKLLRDSLAVKDTARAHSYLDRVLAQRIARGTATDSRPPEIRTSIDTLSLTNADTLEFKVYVSDDTGVGLVTVNGQELYQRGSGRTLLIDHKIT
ncbi:MAG: tetratricopeptide repeat protein, partial [Candidatus Hydrogenedentota bacterium]